MNGMSPEQMQANLNMMNPEMMKNASSMLAGMSDSQLQMYLNQMGMTGVNPQMFRSMCQNMSNMSDSQFNSMKSMAQNNINNRYNNSYNTTNNSNTNSTNSSDNLKGTIVEQVTKMKAEGNELFKKEKFEEAIKKYYEAIEEIKTSLDRDKYKNELNDLERICRLNIASCKLKTKDYDGVINECSIVLETNKCFKAYLRMGLALFHKEKYDKAFRYLDNANAIGNQNEKKMVEPHLKECKEKLDEFKKKEREERLRKEKEKEKEKENEKKKEENNINNDINEIKDQKKEINKEKDVNNEKNEIKDENKINENIINNKDKTQKEERKETKDSKLDNLRNVIEQEKEKNKKNKEKEEEEDEIKIEDTKDSFYSNNFNNNNNNNMNNNINNNFNNNINMPPRYNQDYINQARNQMINMTDEQLEQMIQNLKNMDNQTLKNLMAAQGMNLSDEQIEMMKNSLSPELLRMVQNQNFQNPPMNQNNNNNINNDNTNNNINTNNITNNNAQNPPMPNLGNLGNMDFTQMMEFIKKNPQILKMVSPQLSKMMGGKDIDPEIMMKSMENIMWIFSIPGRIKRFMLSWRGICLIVFIIVIFYGIFKR